MILHQSWTAVLAICVVISLLGVSVTNAGAGETPAFDFYLGGGAGTDPGDDDRAGHGLFAAEYRVVSSVAVGLEGFRTRWTSGGDRLLLSVIASAHVLHNDFVDPWVKVGFGYANIKWGDHRSSSDSKAEFVPVLGGGLSVGWRYVALFGETSFRFHARNDYSVLSLTLGLAAHVF